MLQTIDNYDGIVATAAGVCVPRARLTLGFARRGWAAFVPEAAAGARSGTRIVGSAVAARLFPRRRVPAIGLPWHRPLALGAVTLAVAPAGSGPGTALLTVGDAERVVLDARWAGGAPWGPFAWEGTPPADAVIVDSRRLVEPGAEWAAVLAGVRAWARGGQAVTPDAVVGAVLALDLAANGVLATVRGRVRRALGQWAAERLIARGAAADLLAPTPLARPLTISDAPLPAASTCWISEPGARAPEGTVAFAFSRFGAPGPLLAMVRACGARTVLDIGSQTAALAGALAGEGIHVLRLRPPQLPLPGAG